MGCTEILKARVSPEIKLQAKAIADRELLTESAWLKRLVVRELRARDTANDGDRDLCRVSDSRRPVREVGGPGGRCKPVFVRFRDDDRVLLDARAEARGMRPATYVSVLVRAHIRTLTPLPKDELLAIKRSIAELASIGRNINQIARAANEGGKAPGSVRDDLRAMLKICEALRDNTKALLKANEISWDTGYAKANL